MYTFIIPVFTQNVDRENSNRVKLEEGALAVSKIKAKAQAVRIV